MDTEQPFPQVEGTVWTHRRLWELCRNDITTIFFGVTTWTAMKNSMNIVSATAGLAKIAKEHNASKLADDYRISLGFDYDKQKADKARILGCTTSSCNSLINVTKTLNNSKAVNHSPCYTVTYSLHSVNSVKLYIYFSSST